ncbi:MFS general substrate transporter [Teratosphaeria nubilosa]|uniref:MFS general substrate transporter n=1 Tax=Teratosphaeria nubilosa TaxID=161662 RepID=A0A6G1L932_9PEZI|nr:MFS general substrate transporter [Teratosphaeria nubilosa]
MTPPILTIGTSKKLFVVVAFAILVMNSTIGSSIAAGGSQETDQHFNISNQAFEVLPTSIYLVGYVLGPFVFPPLSESFGRKPIMIATFIPFTAFTLGCALAPTYAGLVVFRLLVGISASTPISVIGGVYADIYNTRKARGLVITLFMVATTWGPLIGPVAFGFAAPADWRWAYWIALIIAGFTWPFLLLMPETFGPIILKRKAQRLRKETGNEKIVAPVELEKQDLRELVVRVLTRPVRMFLFETMCLTTCLYLSVVYGIFYSVYGFNAGEEGLSFLPIGIGAIVAGAVYLDWDNHLDRSLNKTPPPKWTQIEEYARLPLACLGGPLFVASLFWLGWTARPNIHWIVPTLSTLPFGTGFLLIFMGELNYLVDAYEIYAASAMGAASEARSLFGVVLPFAAKPMYVGLGIAWACSLLGFLSLVMACIPFFFIRYGDRIRAGSKFCQELCHQKEAKEAKEMNERESRSQVVSHPPDKQV